MAMMMSLMVYALRIPLYVGGIAIVFGAFLLYDLMVIVGWLYQLGAWRLQMRHPSIESRRV